VRKRSTRRGVRLPGRGAPVSPVPPAGPCSAAARLSRSFRHGQERAPAADLQTLAAAEGRGVEELLREVAQFRLALATDLTIAAAAADIAAPAVAADTVEGSRADLRALEDRLLGHLDGLVGAPVRDAPAEGGHAPARRRRAHRTWQTALLHPAPLLALAAAVGLLTGLAAPRPVPSPAGGIAAAASASFATLSTAVGSGDRVGTAGAGRVLHRDIAALVGRAASGDAGAARDAARLILAENAVLGAVPGTEGDLLRAGLASLATRLVTGAGAPLSVLANTPVDAPPVGVDAAAARLPLPGPLPVLPRAVPSSGSAVPASYEEARTATGRDPASRLASRPLATTSAGSTTAGSTTASATSRLTAPAPSAPTSPVTTLPTTPLTTAPVATSAPLSPSRPLPTPAPAPSAAVAPVAGGSRPAPPTTSTPLLPSLPLPVVAPTPGSSPYAGTNGTASPPTGSSGTPLLFPAGRPPVDKDDGAPAPVLPAPGPIPAP